MSNRLLKINNVRIDIDNATAIGIDFQGYDVKDPANRKVTVTNSFSIPATSNNMNVFGFAGNPQSLDISVYKKAVLDFWIGNEYLIKNASVRVDSVIQDSRIKLFASKKEDLWDLIKTFSWDDFAKELVTFLQIEKGYPSSQFPASSFTEMIEPYLNTTEGLIIPFYLGNLYNFDPGGGENYIETPDQIYMNYSEDSSKYIPGFSFPNRDTRADGGHICVFYKTIFEFIEYKYDVRFATNGGLLLGNIWDDEYAKKAYIPIRAINITLRSNGGFLDWYFDYSDSNQYLPLTDVTDKSGKSLYDAVNLFFQRFNIIKDNVRLVTNDYIRLARFDDLDAKAVVEDWSGNLRNPYTFKPYISGYAQENLIKFGSVFEGGDSLRGARSLTCLNENIDAKVDLFEVDEFYPKVVGVRGQNILDLSEQGAFNAFNVFISREVTNKAINIKSLTGSMFSQSVSAVMQVAAVYSLDSEYKLLDNALDYPKVYEVEKWLTINDVKDLQYFKLYFFKELNGSFFLNKISGFNPTKSNNPTKLELLKVSDRFPISPPNLDYYMDGVEDPYIDGNGDYYY